MKKIIYLLFIFSFIISVNAQEKPTAEELSKGIEELQKTSKSLMNYYQKYEENTSDKDKKKAFDKAVDDMSEGEATQNDKDKAFKLIDAYIKADNAPAQPHPAKKEVKLEDHPEVKKQAQQQFNTAKNELLNLSYKEFEARIWIIKPMASKREIKESYNQLHKNDGRSVSITAADDELTKTQKQVNAFNQMEAAKTYEEYSNAIKTLMPNASEKDMRKAWEELKRQRNKNK